MVTAFSFVESTLMHSTTFADYLGMEPGYFASVAVGGATAPADGGAGGARDRRRPGRGGAVRARRQHPLGHQLLGHDRDGARDEPRRLRGPLRADHDRRLRPARPALHVRARRAPGGARRGRGDPVRARRAQVERDAARRGHDRGRHERPLDRHALPRHGLLAGLRRRRRLPRDDGRPGQVDAAQAGLHHRHRRGLLAPVHHLGHLGRRRPPGPRPGRPARHGGRRDHRARTSTSPRSTTRSASRR